MENTARFPVCGTRLLILKNIMTNQWKDFRNSTLFRDVISIPPCRNKLGTQHPGTVDALRDKDDSSVSNDRFSFSGNQSY